MINLIKAFGLDSTQLPSDWSSFRDMLDDIKKYVVKTGDKVIAADDPGCNHNPQRVPRIGYCSMNGKEWTIKLSNVKLQQYDDILKLVGKPINRKELIIWLNGEM
jgi:hypothetical protein